MFFFVAVRFVSVFCFSSDRLSYFGSVYVCSVEFTGRMFRFGLAWLVRSN